MIIPGFNENADVGKVNKVNVWVFDSKFSPKCNACGEISIGSPTNFCPDCGAMMINKDEAVRFYRDALAEGKKND